MRNMTTYNIKKYLDFIGKLPKVFDKKGRFNIFNLMYKFLTIHVISILILILLLAGTSVAALMPEYERLSPLTTNISAPTAVALDGNECIFVTESSRNVLHIFTQGGEYSESLTGLKKPISLAVDSNDRIFVGNKGRGNVEVYDEDLSLLFKLGSGDGEFTQPGAIAIDNSENIYVVDSDEDLVKVYNPDGSVNFTFGGSGGLDGEFNFPTGIAINETTEELIVADRQLVADVYGAPIQGARVQIFDMNGIFKRSFGEYGVGEGLMTRPVGVSVDGEGRIYVADAMQHAVHVFDGSNGTSLGTILDVENTMRSPLHVVYGGSNRLFITSLKTGKLEIYGLDSYTNMQASPLSLSYTGVESLSVPAGQDVVITNNGSGPLNWTAAADSDWIDLSVSSGIAEVSGTSTLTIGVDLTGLAVGTYTGYVTIGSGTSAVDVVTVTLIVTELPPLVADAGGPYSANEGADVVLDGSGSNGAVILYEWDVDCDGIYEYSTASSTQLHTYAQNGTYTVYLRVTDVGGNTSEASVTATITDTSPAADFTASAISGSVPLVVSFTNTSTGYDQLVNYSWDFDNDAVSDSSQENPTYIFTEAGSYAVSLTVTDSDGSTNTLTKTGYIKVSASSKIEGCSKSPVKRGNSSYHSTVQSAYDTSAEGEIIRFHKQEIGTDTLSISRNVTVTMKGGYNCDYSGTEGMTTIVGNLIIDDGTVIIENIILE
jgi:PKD repeat protein